MLFISKFLWSLTRGVITRSTPFKYNAQRRKLLEKQTAHFHNWYLLLILPNKVNMDVAIKLLVNKGICQYKHDISADVWHMVVRDTTLRIQGMKERQNLLFLHWTCLVDLFEGPIRVIVCMFCLKFSPGFFQNCGAFLNQISDVFSLRSMLNWGPYNVFYTIFGLKSRKCNLGHLVWFLLFLWFWSDVPPKNNNNNKIIQIINK